jgi:iron complex transport system ATP-binding protein
MIRWQAVKVAYNGSFVVGPVDLEAGNGEWLALIGPNGAGKSTLLKAAVGGVEFEGEVTLEGAASRPGIDIAWMPQRPTLPDEMTVAQYALLGRTPYLSYMQSERQADFVATEEALQRLDLSGLAHRKLRTLSGGEAQRVVLARALAQESPVLLLDEPTSSLDLGHAVEVLELIDTLRADRQLTVVTAIHDLTLAERFADRLVLMSGGRIVEQGAGPEVLTASVLAEHYGPGLDVLDHRGRPTVVPSRERHDGPSRPTN